MNFAETGRFAGSRDEICEAAAQYAQSRIDNYFEQPAPIVTRRYRARTCEATLEFACRPRRVPCAMRVGSPETPAAAHYIRSAVVSHSIPAAATS